MTSPSSENTRSALLAFKGENVRSFRDEFEFSLLSTSLSMKDVIRQTSWREDGDAVGVLPVAGIFGGNASGKSNLLRAMSDMRMLALTSFQLANPTGGVTRTPFKLDTHSRTEPSSYEIDLILNGVRHVYGLSVNDERVIDEWAYRYPKGRQALTYRRHGDEFEFGPAERAQGRATEKLVRPNSLFLSVAAATNHPTLLPLYRWFEQNLEIASDGTRVHRQALTTQLLEDERKGLQVLALLRAADLGITGIERKEQDPVIKDRIHRALRILAGDDHTTEAGEALPPIEEFSIYLLHESPEKAIPLEIHEESLGTLVWLGLIGPVVQTLERGTVLLADDLDTSLHPLLASELIRLFQDPSSNPRGAQLIFNSHNVELLDENNGERILGRDQIWLTEKRPGGDCHVYPLSDNAPRKDEAIARRYLSGRYGAVPILAHQDFESAVNMSATVASR